MSDSSDLQDFCVDINKYRRSLVNTATYNTATAKMANCFRHAQRRAKMRYDLDLSEDLWRTFYNLTVNLKPENRSVVRDSSIYLVRYQERTYRIAIRISLKCVVSFLPYNPPPDYTVWQPIKPDDCYTVKDFPYGALAVNSETNHIELAWGIGIQPCKKQIYDLCMQYGIDPLKYQFKMYGGNDWRYRLAQYQSNM